MPHEGGLGSVELSHVDLPRLDDQEFLNDTCIDFYCRCVGEGGLR